MSYPLLECAGMSTPKDDPRRDLSPSTSRDSVTLSPGMAAELRTRIRIRLEPAIEAQCLGKSVEELERLAATHFRLAKQTWLRAAVLRQELGLPPAPRPRSSASSYPRKVRRARAADATPDLPWSAPLDDIPGVPI